MFDDLRADETELVGQWVASGQEVVADPVARRIAWLVAERLERAGSDAPGWVRRFRDPRDGRVWELTYPDSSLHGGGPPTLRCIAS